MLCAIVLFVTIENGEDAQARVEWGEVLKSVLETRIKVNERRRESSGGYVSERKIAKNLFRRGRRTLNFETDAIMSILRISYLPRFLECRLSRLSFCVASLSCHWHGLRLTFWLAIDVIKENGYKLYHLFSIGIDRYGQGESEYNTNNKKWTFDADDEICEQCAAK